MTTIYDACMSKYKKKVLSLLDEQFGMYPDHLSKSELCIIFSVLHGDNSDIISQLLRQKYDIRISELKHYHPEEILGLIEDLVTERNNLKYIRRAGGPYPSMLDDIINTLRSEIINLRSFVPPQQQAAAVIDYARIEESTKKIIDEYMKKKAEPIILGLEEDTQQQLSSINGIDALVALLKKGISINTTDVVAAIKEAMKLPSKIQVEPQFTAEEKKKLMSYLENKDTNQLSDYAAKISNEYLKNQAEFLSKLISAKEDVPRFQKDLSILNNKLIDIKDNLSSTDSSLNSKLSDLSKQLTHINEHHENSLSLIDNKGQVEKALKTLSKEVQNQLVNKPEDPALKEVEGWINKFFNIFFGKKQQDVQLSPNPDLMFGEKQQDIQLPPSVIPPPNPDQVKQIREQQNTNPVRNKLHSAFSLPDQLPNDIIQSHPQPLSPQVSIYKTALDDIPGQVESNVPYEKPSIVITEPEYEYEYEPEPERDSTVTIDPGRGARYKADGQHLNLPSFPRVHFNKSGQQDLTDINNRQFNRPPAPYPVLNPYIGTSRVVDDRHDPSYGSGVYYSGDMIARQQNVIDLTRKLLDISAYNIHYAINNPFFVIDNRINELEKSIRDFILRTDKDHAENKTVVNGIVTSIKKVQDDIESLLNRFSTVKNTSISPNIIPLYDHYGSIVTELGQINTILRKWSNDLINRTEVNERLEALERSILNRIDQIEIHSADIKDKSEGNSEIQIILEKQLSEKEDLINKLNEDIKNKTDDLGRSVSLAHELQEKVKAGEKIQEENVHLKNDLNKLNNKIEEYRAEVSNLHELERQKQALEGKVKELEEERNRSGDESKKFDILRVQLEQQNEKYQNLRNQLSSKDREIDRLTTQLKDIQTKISDDESEIKELSGKLEQYKQDYKILKVIEGQYNILKEKQVQDPRYLEQLDKCHEQIEALKADINQYQLIQEKLKTKEEELERYRNLEEKTKQQCNKLLAEKDAKIANLENQIKNFQQKEDSAAIESIKEINSAKRRQSTPRIYSPDINDAWRKYCNDKQKLVEKNKHTLEQKKKDVVNKIIKMMKIVAKKKILHPRIAQQYDTYSNEYHFSETNEQYMKNKWWDNAFDVGNRLNKFKGINCDTIDKASYEGLWDQYQTAYQDYDDAYYKVRDLYENITGIGRIYIRIRPFIPEQDTSQKIFSFPDINSIQLTSNPEVTYGPFDKIFEPEKKTFDVYSEYANSCRRGICDLINNMIHTSQNVMLLAYGQSGSGKTRTLLGEPPNHNGLLSLIINNLMDLKKSPTETTFLGKLEQLSITNVSIAMFHIYKGKIYNLYDAVVQSHLKGNTKEDKFILPNENYKKHLTIRSFFDNTKETQFVDIESSPFDANGMNILKYVNSRRFQREVMLNDNSSRSHAFIDIRIQAKKLKPRPGTANIIECHLVLGDLCGNEHILDNQSNTEAFQEGQSIIKELKSIITIINDYKKGKPVQVGIATQGSGRLMVDLFNYYLKPSSESSQDNINKLVFLLHMRGFIPVNVISKINGKVDEKTTKAKIKQTYETTQATLVFAQNLLT